MVAFADRSGLSRRDDLFNAGNRHIQNGDTLNDAGVVDEDIDGTHILLKLRDTAIYVGFVCDVENQGLNLDTRLRGPSLTTLEIFLGDVVNTNLGPSQS